MQTKQKEQKKAGRRNNDKAPVGQRLKNNLNLSMDIINIMHHESVGTVLIITHLLVCITNLTRSISNSRVKTTRTHALPMKYSIYTGFIIQCCAGLFTVFVTPFLYISAQV